MPIPSQQSSEHSLRDHAGRRTVVERLLIMMSVLGAFCGLHAQTLAVQPVNVIMPAGQKITTLTVRNPASEPITIQVRAYAWGQNGNDDPLDPTDAVLVSPPMATIEPGESQIVRVAMRKPVSDREGTYRLLIDQLPPPSRPKGISVLLRLSVPVFVEPAERATPKVNFRVEHAPDGKFFLVVVNSGQCHDSLHDIRLKSADGAAWKAAVPGLPYVLAGAERRWPIRPEGSSHDIPRAFSITAQTDAGPIARQVSVSEAP